MAHPLAGVDAKLDRAVTHINNLQQQVAVFADREPYTVRVDEKPQQGGTVGHLTAVRNHSVGPYDVGMVLLAGEALYQLRSALDHLLHQLVILNGNAAKLIGSRQHQFPIFETSDGYRANAPRKIDGVSNHVARLIEGEQPYSRRPHAPREDPLWLLQDLNNTDKHRVIPTTMVQLGTAEARADNESGVLFYVNGSVELKDDEVFFTYSHDGRYQNINAKLRCSVAFAQAPETIGGMGIGMDGQLFYIANRVGQAIEAFRSQFS